METNSQHEFHPDAGSLNAFAERALGERERSEVLKHLAVCGRCRHVVALAWEAAGAEAAAKVAPTEAEPVTVRPNAWWNRWRLVWVPTAVVAAFAVASISLFIRQTGQHDANIKVAEQTATRGKGPASVPPQPIEAEAAPVPVVPAPAVPAPAVPAPPEANALKAKRSRVEARQQAPELAAPSAMPRQPEAIDRAELAPVQSAPAARAEVPGLAGDGFLAGGRPTVYKAPEAAAWQEEQKQQEEKELQTENAKVRSELFAAKAAPPASDHSADSGAQASSAQVVVLDKEAELQAAPVARFGGFERSRPAAIAAGTMRPIHLPSNLSPVSIAIADHRMLAIDEAGALFFSDDSGSTWKSVPQQWTDRAIQVHKQTAGQAGAEQAPAIGGVSNTAAEAGGIPAAATVFELLNDKGQVWLSTDGKTWVAK